MQAAEFDDKSAAWLSTRKTKKERGGLELIHFKRWKIDNLWQQSIFYHEGFL